MIALLCPGQGSQTPGMLNEWLELEGAAEFLQELSEASGVDLIALGTTADAEEIKDTAVAQPLIVAASLLAANVLIGECGPVHTWAGAVAGHSVGEFTATAIAGVLSPAQAASLVGVRGRAMAAAAAQASSGMAAVMGSDPQAVTEAITAAGLTPANVNGAGQVVAAGSTESLAAFAAHPPAKTRVVPLPVAGAFHTEFMASAQAPVADAAAELHPGEPTVTLLSNTDGQAVDGAQMLSRLVSQITSPVRWDLCQAALADRGTSAVIELTPGGVLTGLARRTLRGVPSVAIKNPADLDAAIRLIQENA